MTSPEAFLFAKEPSKEEMAEFRRKLYTVHYDDDDDLADLFPKLFGEYKEPLDDIPYLEPQGFDQNALFPRKPKWIT